MKFLLSRSGGLALVVGAAALLSSVFPAQAQAPNAALIAANCAVCHGQGGSGAGDIAKINEQSPKQIADNMRAFRDGKKPSTIMGRITKGYSDVQIDTVANHLGKK